MTQLELYGLGRAGHAFHYCALQQAVPNLTKVRRSTADVRRDGIFEEGEVLVSRQRVRLLHQEF